MDMKKFNFRKVVKRNDFTIVFGGVGKRRTLLHFVSKKSFRKSWIRFKIIQIRRAHQGRKNKVFGSMHALRIRRAYGRRKPLAQFRR
jgi:hypothetical protein